MYKKKSFFSTDDCLCRVARRTQYLLKHLFFVAIQVWHVQRPIEPVSTCNVVVKVLHLIIRIAVRERSTYRTYGLNCVLGLMVFEHVRDEVSSSVKVVALFQCCKKAVNLSIDYFRWVFIGIETQL